MGRFATAALLLSLGACGLAHAEEPSPSPVTASDPRDYAIGARVRGIFLPRAFLSSFLTASTSLASVSLGLDFVYRRPTYDVVTSLDFGFVSMGDGNFLAAGHDPTMDTHYTQFRNLDFLSADVSIIGHHAVLPWLELRYGAGLGLGVVLGQVLLTNDGMQCTNQNAGNIKQCYPISPTLGPIMLGTSSSEAQLKATEAPGQLDTAANPHRHVTNDTPPMMPVFNIVAGADFRLHRRLTMGVEFGFRDALFVGAMLHVWF